MSEEVETVEQLKAENEFVLELDKLPKQGHIWIDRGLKLTCEDAGHPWHEAWKVRKPSI